MIASIGVLQEQQMEWHSKVLIQIREVEGLWPYAQLKRQYK